MQYAIDYARTAGLLALIQLLRYLIFPGVALYLVAGQTREWARKRRIQPVDFQAADLIREFATSMSTVVIFALVFAIAHTRGLAPHTRIYSDWRAHGLPWLLASLPVLLLFHDAYFYWMHRLVHQPALFKAVHRVHHLSRNPSPLAAYAFHPWEALLEAVWVLPVLFLIPIHQAVLIAFALVSLAMSVIGHLGVEIYPESWRRHPVMRWLNSPTRHNAHHQYFRGNYGLYFMFWDRLMGTER
jgi:sterol desaturase/sphingolipid hydroxylase (fatty acid hydroxylase superfamily)